MLDRESALAVPATGACQSDAHAPAPTNACVAAYGHLQAHNRSARTYAATSGEARRRQWTLPARLRPSDLPANAGDAWRARIAALSPLARSITQTHALLGIRSLGRDAYAQLTPEASVAQLDSALLALIGAEVLQSDHERYQLSHPALLDILCDTLDAHDKQRRHLALYELHVRSGETHPYVLIPHLVAAGRHDAAFDVLDDNSAWLDRQGEDAIEQLDAVRVAESLERMLEVFETRGRAARDCHELRRRLCAFAVVIDDALHARVAPIWLRQLCHDSGLTDYRASAVDAPPGERLERALATASARYEATPLSQRVYRVDEAIKQLAVYVVTAIVVGVRANDGRLVQSLPGLLEPFAALSPALHAIWQNVVGLVESQVFGRRVSAARRNREVYAHLSTLKGEDVPYLQAIRGAVCNALGWYEASIGSHAAFGWAEKLDADRLQCVAAMEIRRMACLVRGDLERADEYGRQAELRALGAHVRRMFDRPWALELETAVLASELGRIKRVMDDVAPLAAKCPAWDAQLSDLLTRETQQSSPPRIAQYCAEDGVDRQLVVLSCRVGDELVFAGLAVVAASSRTNPAPDTADYASALAAELLARGDSCGARG